MATLGGIIELNGALFGLSVSHAFSTLAQTYDETDSIYQSDTELFALDEDDLDPFVRTTSSDDYPNDAKQTSNNLDASESSANDTGAIEAEDTSTSPRVDTDTGDPPMSQRVDSEMTKWYALF